MQSADHDGVSILLPLKHLYKLGWGEQPVLMQFDEVNKLPKGRKGIDCYGKAIHKQQHLKISTFNNPSPTPELTVFAVFPNCAGNGDDNEKSPWFADFKTLWYQCWDASDTLWSRVKPTPGNERLRTSAAATFSGTKSVVATEPKISIVWALFYEVANTSAQFRNTLSDNRCIVFIRNVGAKRADTSRHMDDLAVYRASRALYAKINPDWCLAGESSTCDVAITTVVSTVTGSPDGASQHDRVACAAFLRRDWLVDNLLASGAKSYSYIF